MTSHIRTFRYKLMKAVPAYQFIDFHYNIRTKIAYPGFYSLAHDTHFVYAMFELAGNERIRFIEDYFYAYYASTIYSNQCNVLHERLDHQKATTRNRLQKLNSLNEKGTRILDNKLPKDFDTPALPLLINLKDAKCFNYTEK